MSELSLEEDQQITEQIAAMEEEKRLEEADTSRLIPGTMEDQSDALPPIGEVNPNISVSSFTTPEAPALKLDDLLTANARAPIVSVANRGNITIHAIATSEDPEKTFQVVESALSAESVEGVTPDLGMPDEAVLQREATIDILNDPEVDDEDKQAIVADFQAGIVDKPTVRETTALELLAKGNPGDSEKQLEERVGLSANIRDAIEFKVYQDAQTNMWFAKQDISLMSAGADVAELMVPFMEQKALAKILTKVKAELSSGDLENASNSYVAAMTMLGTSKLTLPEILKSMPLEDRKVALKRVLEIVENNSDILISDENQLFAMGVVAAITDTRLENMGFEMLDNIAGWMDTTMFGGIFWRAATAPVKQFKRLKAFQKAMDEEKFTPPKMVKLELDPNGGFRAVEGTVEETGDNVVNRTIQREAVVNETRPSSLSQTLNEVGGDEKRKVFKIINDGTDQTAQAIAGTTREASLRGELLPHIDTPNSTWKITPYRVQLEDDVARLVDKDSIDAAREGGALRFTMPEVNKMTSAFVNDIRGMTELFPAGIRVKVLDVTDGAGQPGVNYSMLLGGKNGGASDPNLLVDHALVVLSKYGVTGDDITVIAKSADRGFPLTLSPNGGYKAEAGTEYYVQVNAKYDFDPLDLTSAKSFERPGGKLFNALTWGFSDNFHGNLNRYIFDPASIFGKNMVSAMSRAVDKAGRVELSLFRLGNKFTARLDALPADRAKVLEELIYDANANGRAIDGKQMTAKGLNEAEKQTIRAWQNYWDTSWFLENQDLITTLRSKGWGMLSDSKNDTRLIAKPISREKFAEAKDMRVYDHATGRTKALTSKQLDEMYERGATVVELKSSLNTGRKGEKSVKFSVSEQTPGGPYFRGLNERDKLLKYSQGHYNVRYTDNKFIVHKEKDGFERVLMTSPSTKDATVYAQNFANKTDGATFGTFDGGKDVNVWIRGERGADTDADRVGGFDDYWDSNAGRFAQRVRGKNQLESTNTVGSTDGSITHIMNPIDSMMANTRSLGERVAMRDTMEVFKAKWMKQYGHLLSDSNGAKAFPTRTKDIGKGGIEFTDDVVDAKAHWEYIHSMESQQINMVDETVKGLLNVMASMSTNTPGLERFFLASAKSKLANPVSLLKNVGFTSYLALNPFRQAVLQSSQSALLMARFPTYAAKLHGDAAAVVLAKMGDDVGMNALGKEGNALTRSEYMTIWKEFESTGMYQSIDKNLLVRGMLMDLGDAHAPKVRLSAGSVGEAVSSTANLVGKGATATVRGARRLGFDSGEFYNLLTAYVAFRREATLAGTVMNARAVEEVSARARAFTLSMNKAGEMGMNSGTLSLIYQFMSVPHKAILAGFGTNKSLGEADRLAIGVGGIALWGVPPALLTNATVSHLRELTPAAGQYAIDNGMAGAALNFTSSAITGGESNVSFSNLNPADQHGLLDFMAGILTTEVGDIFGNSPSGSLIAGNNPRITEALKSVRSLVDPTDQFHDDTEWYHAAKKVAEISSGMSNIFRARLGLMAEKKISSSGNITDFDASKVENLWQILGFNTHDEKRKRLVDGVMYEKKKDFQDDVDEVWKRTRDLVTTEALIAGDASLTAGAELSITFINGVKELSIMSDILRGANGGAWSEAMSTAIMRDISKNGENSTLEILRRMVGLFTIQEIAALVRLIPESEMTDEGKEEYVKLLQNMQVTIDNKGQTLEDGLGVK